jgi:hypothetical protein
MRYVFPCFQRSASWDLAAQKICSIGQQSWYATVNVTIWQVMFPALVGMDWQGWSTGGEFFIVSSLANLDKKNYH